MDNRWYRPAGSTPAGPWTLTLAPEDAGWSWSGLRVLELSPGTRHEFNTRDDEVLVLPLEGSCTVECGPAQMQLAGRRGVFDGVTDFAYVPRDSLVSVSSDNGGRFAFPAARATRQLPFRYGAADEVPVELRGAGSCSRQVNNFCTPDSFETDKLIACEVLTPGGNWSSYPPHKHDEQRSGPTPEAELEEIYYFEVRSAPDASPGVAYQRVYGNPDRPIDVLAEVRSGDMVLVPHGWHGPSMAAPGYDLYYLNVMAGPAPDRVWLICDDPAHAWVRDTWADQDVDPRLPLSPVPEGQRS